MVGKGAGGWRCSGAFFCFLLWLPCLVAQLDPGLALDSAAANTANYSIALYENATEALPPEYQQTEDVGLALAAAMGEGMSGFWDWWPNLAAAASLFLCLLSLWANTLVPEEDRSHLQSVFSWPCLTTAGVMAALLASLRFDGAKVTEAGLDDVGCQIQGSIVYYLQLATACWMTAGFHSVHRFICDKPEPQAAPAEAGSGQGTAAKKERVNPEQEKPVAGAVLPTTDSRMEDTFDMENDGPSPPNRHSGEASPKMQAQATAAENTQKALMGKYHMVCWGVPLVLTASLLGYAEMISSKVPVFGYQVVRNTGWCTLG